MLVSLYDFISCDVINFKNFRENLRYFFQILATPLKFFDKLIFLNSWHAH